VRQRLDGKKAAAFLKKSGAKNFYFMLHCAGGNAGGTD
jgi:hypothetical protein